VRKLALLSVLWFVVMAAVPAISLGGKGGIGTMDSCAAVVGVEDAGACGNGGSVILSNNGSGTCVWYNPALSPSVWVGPC
jgi:hypothetical protein